MIFRFECFVSRTLPESTSKPPRNEVMEYFTEQYKKANFRVVPGHWPDFTSKEEVDDWISDMNIILNFFEKAKKIDEKTD
jgi:hypothetical protein